MSAIKSMYVDSSSCVRVQVSEGGQFRIDSVDSVLCIYGWRDEGGENGDWKEKSEFPGGWERGEIAWPVVCR